MKALKNINYQSSSVVIYVISALILTLFFVAVSGGQGVFSIELWVYRLIAIALMASAVLNGVLLYYYRRLWFLRILVALLLLCISFLAFGLSLFEISPGSFSA